MKGRDKRRRATGRRVAAETTQRLRQCQAMAASIDETTCIAEQRFQKNQTISRCDGCLHKEDK